MAIHIFFPLKTSKKTGQLSLRGSEKFQLTKRDNGYNSPDSREMWVRPGERRRVAHGYQIDATLQPPARFPFPAS